MNLYIQRTFAAVLAVGCLAAGACASSQQTKYLHPNADLGMIERVLTNLLDNAIRHTPEGGLIELRLRRAGDGVEVQLSDTGPGIPPEKQKDLFTRPSSLHGGERESSGGLGLVIVRRILQLHGSEIRLLPHPDRGTVFRFCLGAPIVIGHDSLNSA